MHGLRTRFWYSRSNNHGTAYLLSWMGSWGHPCPKPSTAFGSARGPQTCQAFRSVWQKTILDRHLPASLCSMLSLIVFIGFQRWTFFQRSCHFPRPTESICWWSLSKAYPEEAAEDEEEAGEPNGYSLLQLHGCQESVRCSISGPVRIGKMTVPQPRQSQNTWVSQSFLCSQWGIMEMIYITRLAIYLGYVSNMKYYSCKVMHISTFTSAPCFQTFPSHPKSSALGYPKARWTSTEAFPSLPSLLWP